MHKMVPEFLAKVTKNRFTKTYICTFREKYLKLSVKYYKMKSINKIRQFSNYYHLFWY